MNLLIFAASTLPGVFAQLGSISSSSLNISVAAQNATKEPPTNNFTRRSYNLGTVPELLSLEKTLLADPKLNDLLKKQALTRVNISTEDQKRMHYSAGNPIHDTFSYIPVPHSVNETLALTNVIHPSVDAGCCNVPRDVYLGNSTYLLNPGTFPVHPWDDPFYEQNPAKYGYMRPGQVLGFRRIGFDSSYYPKCSAFQVSFRTEPSTNNTRTKLDVTTAVIPEVHGTTMVSYQASENSANMACQPSYLFSTGISDPFLQTFLNASYIVNMPDYEGFDSAFTAVNRQGKSVLNSIRALRSLQAPFNITIDRVYLYGYSFGAGASISAAELVRNYAPELTSADKLKYALIQGVAVGGLSVDWTDSLFRMNKGTFSGYVPAAIMSIASEYPAWRYDMLTDVPSAAVPRFAQSIRGCGNTMLLNYLGQDMISTLSSGYGFFNKDNIKPALDDLRLGKTAPPMPVVIYQGSSDEIGSYSQISHLVDFYCKQGVPVEFHLNTNHSHVSEQRFFFQLVPDFFQRLNDQNLPPFCTSYPNALTVDSYFRSS